MASENPPQLSNMMSLLLSRRICSTYAQVSSFDSPCLVSSRKANRSVDSSRNDPRDHADHAKRACHRSRSSSSVRQTQRCTNLVIERLSIRPLNSGNAVPFRQVVLPGPSCRMSIIAIPKHIGESEGQNAARKTFELTRVTFQVSLATPTSIAIAENVVGPEVVALDPQPPDTHSAVHGAGSASSVGCQRRLSLLK